ncbi:hypothetical protein SLA2020_336760 [Shorea laevis]
MPTTYSWSGILSWLCKNIKHKSLYSSLLKLAWSEAIYHIWRERNNHFRQGTFQSGDALLSDIWADVRDHLLGFAKTKASPMSPSIASNWGLEILCMGGRMKRLILEV